MTIKRRIFIVGCPRSGTTLLQSLLASHSQITSFTESHFFDYGIKRPKDLNYYYISQHANSRVKEFVIENKLPQELQHQLLLEMPALPLIPGMGIKTWAKYYQLIFDRISCQRNMENWIEKTPDHLNRITIINRYLDQVWFIHILRNPLDTVASLYTASRKWGKNYSVAQCIYYWNKAIRKHYNHRNDANARFIAYEELAKDPMPVLARSLHFLELEVEPEIVQQYGKTTKRIINKEENWKNNITDDINPRSTYKTVLSNQEIALVRKKANFTLYDTIMKSGQMIR